MPLEAGRRIAHYEVIEPLGAGGMGEVFRARDTKLDRDVAIKVLPDDVASDEERLRRFEREAKLLASLNHPGIAAIHGVEAFEGGQVLVLELVSGETLADRIARGPLSTEDALAIAIQLADALGEAHQREIIHRDLKPANVMVTADEDVKVLDFGLAKADPNAPADGDLSQSPTLTREATETGVILGTAPYMSPEQAKGRPVDRRTDVFSFGAVLFEMLTGRRAFHGDDVADTLAAVLRAEPDWTALPDGTDPRLSALLRGCLQKDRKARRRDLADIATELDDIRTHPIEVRATAPARWSPRWLATAVLAAAVVAGALGWWLRPASPDADVVRFELAFTGEGVGGGRPGATISPDGRRVAFVNDEGLYVRDLERSEPTRVADDARGPFFSPDSRWLGFWSDDKLVKVSLVDETRVTLGDVERTYGASWGDDDTILLGLGLKGIWQISAGGGTARPLVPMEDDIFAHSPQRLPNGAVLFSTNDSGGYIANWSSSKIVVASSETDERRVVADDAFQARYQASGHLVVQRGDSLLAAPFDVSRYELRGDLVSVADDVMTPGSFFPLGSLFETSGEGDLVYVSVDTSSGLQLVWFDRSGNSTPITDTSNAYRRPVISPDGSRIAMHIGEIDGRSDIWIYDVERDSFSRVTTSENNAGPQWSRDGKWLAYRSGRGSENDLYRIRTDFSGPAERLLQRGGRQSPQSFTPDGHGLVYSHYRSDASWDLWYLPLDGSGEPRPLVETPANDYGASVSPDGRYIAYHSSESGASQIYVQTFPEMGPRVQVSRDGGAFPMWTKGGRELVYRDAARIKAVDVDTEPGFDAGVPRVLFEGNFVSNQGKDRDVSPDGERFVMLQRADGAAAENTLQVVVGWRQELERLVPTQH